MKMETVIKKTNVKQKDVLTVEEINMEIKFVNVV